MIKIEGDCGISATIIADSISPAGVRLVTLELEYPRFIHAEFMTHRMLSKNAASTRAIPTGTLIDMIETNPAMPVFWGKNEPGMGAKEEVSDFNKDAAKSVWKEAANVMTSFAKVLTNKAGINLHKQIAGRILEPWVTIKTIVSGTEWNNFIWLRDHPDAQPEIQELARCIKTAMEQSIPEKLVPGEWHLPYIVRRGSEYWVDEETQVDLETAKIVSASCCAQVSYRKLDDSIEKAQKIFSMLNIGSTEKPCHASPLEHQATPMRSLTYDAASKEGHYTVKYCGNLPQFSSTWEEGVTHVRRDGTMWSGNFQGFIQLRQLIPNEAKW